MHLLNYGAKWRAQFSNTCNFWLFAHCTCTDCNTNMAHQIRKCTAPSTQQLIACRRDEILPSAEDGFSRLHPNNLASASDCSWWVLYLFQYFAILAYLYLPRASLSASEHQCNNYSNLTAGVIWCADNNATTDGGGHTSRALIVGVAKTF